jgi:hypothetical protein
VKAPLVQGACPGNRRGKAHYLGTTAVVNPSTNLNAAAAAQREARLSTDIVHNVQVPLKLHNGGISYLSDADDACCPLVKLINSAT